MSQNVDFDPDPRLIERLEDVVWQPTVGDRTFDVPLDVRVHRDALEEGELTLVFAAFEGRFCGLKKVVKNSAELGEGVAATRMRFDVLPASDEQEFFARIHQTLVEATQFLIDTVIERSNKPAGSSVKVIAPSQDGATAIVGVSENPENVSHLIVVNSVAINTASFGSTLPERRREFLKREGKNLLAPEQQVWNDLSNIGAGIEIGAQIMLDLMARRFRGKDASFVQWLRHSRFFGKLNYAMDLQNSDEIQQRIVTLDQNPDIFFAMLKSDGDPIFPEKDDRAALRSVGTEELLVVEKNNSHSSIQTQAGRRLLKVCFDLIRDNPMPVSESV